MRYLAIAFFLTFLQPANLFADYYHEPTPNSSTTIVNGTHEHGGNHSNFYIPLEAEVNVTPQKYRKSWFQGIFSTTGVELANNEEPNFWTGFIAKFDIFPEKDAA